jgi:hypothetical protein
VRPELERQRENLADARAKLLNLQREMGHKGPGATIPQLNRMRSEVDAASDEVKRLAGIVRRLEGK